MSLFSKEELKYGVRKIQQKFDLGCKQFPEMMDEQKIKLLVRAIIDVCDDLNEERLNVTD